LLMQNPLNGEREKCPICKGLGYIFTDKGVKKCQCQLKEFNIVKFLNIPKRFQEADLREVKRNLAPGKWEFLKNYLRDFLTYYRKGIGLLFIGAPGVGKTYTVCAILKFIYKKYRIPGYFTDTKELSIKFRKAFESDEASKVLNALFKVPVLVLDDLGNETLTDWYKEILTSLINARYNEKKLTFITTNYYPLYLLQKETRKNQGGVVVRKNPQENMKKEFQDLPTLDSRYGSHIVSRLAEMTLPFTMLGTDQRKIKGAIYY
jgi:DNA replication protein DnaC